MTNHITYKVLTLNEVQEQGENFVNRLVNDYGIDFSLLQKKSSYPSSQQLSEALRVLNLNLESLAKRNFYGKLEWKAYVENSYSQEWVEIICEEYSLSKKNSLNFYFSQGHPSMMKLILSELARTCGPLLLFGPDYVSLEDGNR